MFRRTIVISFTAALVALGLLVAPTGAGASGGEQGVLRIHGPGSAFAGSFAIASQVVSAPGSTGTFALQVKNNGPALAQFNLQVFYLGALCTGTCPQPIDTLSAGSLIVTQLAHAPNGYYTAPIAAGKTAPFTFKVVTPKAPNSVAGDTFEYEIGLFDTGGNLLDFEFAYVSNKVAKGAVGADQYVSSSGTAATTNLPTGLMAVTAPAIAVGATATFNIKLQNDSAVAEAIQYSLSDFGDCSSHFAVKVVVGTTDVTAPVMAGTYATPVRAPGASTTLKLTVKYVDSAAACLSGSGQGYLFASGVASNSNSATAMYFIVDPVATN